MCSARLSGTTLVLDSSRARASTISIKVSCARLCYCILTNPLSIHSQRPYQSSDTLRRSDVMPRPSFYDEVELEDMSYDEDRDLFHYPCPCGDRFEITRQQLRDAEDVAKCPSCSLIIRIIFDPVRGSVLMFDIWDRLLTREKYASIQLDFEDDDEEGIGASPNEMQAEPMWVSFLCRSMKHATDTRERFVSSSAAC